MIANVMALGTQHMCCHVVLLRLGQSLRLSDRREGAREIRLYQDEVYTRLINLSCNLQKFQEGIKSYEHF